jgi:phosphoribosylamine--glycine ligase
MNVLVVGNGGREAALAWKIAQSETVSGVHVFPYHPAAGVLSPKIQSTETTLETLLSTLTFELAVIGPEAYLEANLANELRARGIPTVGPSALAARLETSKAFAKEIMQLAGVPTARSVTFYQSTEAQAFVELCDWTGVVVKADGPAAGKGVVVAHDKAHALSAIRGFFDGSYLGTKISCVLLEEKLTGPELSAFAICSGSEFVWLGAARDHKRLKNNDEGPNTGGMGVVAPLNDLSADERSMIERDVFAPVLKTMQQKHMPFQGFLFAGLMRTENGLKVLEFNTRLGDPETQVLMPLIEEDIMPWLMGCAKGALPKRSPVVSSQTAVHVVLAAPGYPGTEGEKVQLGDVVAFDASREESVLVFPAGLAEKNDQWVSRGGRILGVTALAGSTREARERALQTINNLSFPGAQWRTDIGGVL